MSDRKGDPGSGIGTWWDASSKAVVRARRRHAARAFAAALCLLALLSSAGALAAGAVPSAGEEDGAAVADELIVGPEAEEVVELPQERTADSASFELEDGSMETRIYAAPVNFLDGEGDWERIGSRLRENEDGEVVNGPNSFDVTLPERLDDDPVRLAVDDDTWIESRLVTGDVGPVELEDGTASYESSKSGPSFELTGIPTGLKEEIEIADPSQPSTYDYALTASADLQPRLDPDGAIRFLDASESVVAELPPPSMRDSSDAAVPSQAVHYELSADGEGGWRLKVVADEAWLSDPQRNFPVVIDPTMTVAKPSLECTIGGKTGQEGWIDCASWGRKELLAGIEVGTEPKDDGWYRTLMDVLTTSIPKNAKVSAATFVMTGVAAPHYTSGVELREITQPWSWQANWRRYDGTNNWTNEGGDFGQSLGQVSPGVTGTWKFAMPKKAVEEKISKGETLRLMLKLIDDKDRNCSCDRRFQAFYSSSVTEAAKRPYLSVQWDYPVAEELAVLPTLDPLNRTETLLSNGGKWSPLNWATNTGRDTTAGWGPSDAFPTINGAYWKPATFSDGKGTVAALTMPTSPGGAERYVSLWLEMPSPGSEKSGYELRWTVVSGTSYAVKLSKWVAGTETVLASSPAVTIPAGATMAITDHGGTVSAWQGSGGSMASILTASDSSYSAGYAGLAGAGNISRSINFKAAELATPLPTTTTSVATGVKVNQATLAGSVNPNGSATTYQFEYGTTTAYGSNVPASPKAIGSGAAAVEVSEPITGLTTGTTYHYRLVATNGAGTSKGEDKRFTTAAPPLVTTEAATEASATEAKLNATVNPRGVATTYQFEYGPTTSYGSVVPASPEAIGAGSADVAVSKTITGLTEGSTYHYRVVAESEGGKTYGADNTLTAPYLPDATTEAAARINANEATLAAEVDPNGDTATYSFEYGTTAGYGEMAPSAGEKAGEEGEPRNATDSIRDLAPETTYHYRVVARSDGGTVKGVDRTFTTSARVKTPAEEAEQKQQEQNYDASKDKNPIGSNYMGMMWSGDVKAMARRNVQAAVYHSGSRYLRQNFYPDGEKYPEATMRKIVQEAASRGVAILPYFGWGWPDEGSVKNVWIPYITKMVNTYGPGGSYWATNGSSPDMPIKMWEIGNEPNLGGNGPYAGVPRNTPLTKAEIEGYGKRFAEASAAAKAAAAPKGGISVLLSGLFSTSPTNCSEGECHTDVYDFLRKMGSNGSYDAISVHPYVLALGKDHDKLTPGDAKRVTDITHKKVVEAREALEDEGKAQKDPSQGKKPIWITEIGWATANEKTPKLSPPVSEETQRKLIESTFEMLKADHDELGIAHVFYYNIQDNPLANESGSHEKRNWDHFSGLRRAGGKKKKEAWLGFTKVAKGDAWWPRQETTKKRPADNVKGKSGRLNLLVNSDGSGISGKFQIWKKAANPTVVDVAPFETEGAEGDELVSGMASGLQPVTTYVFHGVVTNEEEEAVVSENEEFTTPPSTSTSTNVRRVLHGQPGYVWIEGWVKEGEINGPLPGLSNVHVHVRLYRNGQFQRFADVMTNGEGHYDSGYMEVGKGDWEVSTEFPGGGEWDRSETVPPKTFTVRDGVRIRAQHSNGCWDIFGAQQQNGAAVMHGACNEPPSSNQVFELKPQLGGQYLNIVARNSGRCVDVDNGSFADGSGLQQYDCLGAGQANQLFWEAWAGNYLAYVAKHSNKCVDVTGANQGWTHLQQWTCNGNPQQVVYLEPAESGPKPTETFISTSHVIHGNGQWGNNWGRISSTGHLLAGAYSMQNRIVQVEFEKLVGGNYVRTDNRAVAVNWDGSYELPDYALAPGIWRVRAEFVGNGEYQGSTSNWHDFSIFQANRLIARHSGKCLSLSENKNVNGQHLIQWDCAGTGSLQDGQTFWFWPDPTWGPHAYAITVISSGKCLDIANGSGANGADLQQWDCNGYGQQRWELLPIAGQAPYYALRPLHSHKCLDVAGAGGGNGAEVWQWDCHWGGNQQWLVSGVVGG